MALAFRIASMIGVVLMVCLLAGCAAMPADKQEEQIRAKAEDLQWFQDAKFGLFIHWGPVSLKGTEIGWSRGGERRGRKDNGTQVPVDVYDNLYKQFNPTKFDADALAALAKSAGMKYLVFVSKHHDGFSMFDTKLSEYKITRSPYGHDICEQVAAACHKEELKLGWYYSPPDWHNSDYRTARHRRYIDYMHGQLNELCTKYGKVDVIWFDGLGGTAQDWDSYRMIGEIRRLQPGVLVNNRAGTKGDFDTPEQRIGRFQVDRPWESCITIGQQWSYKPNDKVKSLKECVNILVRTVGDGGNLLFNVGPMPDGQIEPVQAERLREIGAWLRPVGPSIYGTHCGPYRPMPWGVTTHRDSKIYVHILEWDSDTIVLPAIPQKVVSASLLTGGQAQVKQTDKGIEIRVPTQDRQALDTVVVMDMDGSVDAVRPILIPSGSLAIGKKVTASSPQGKFALASAVDDDYTTSWVPNKDDAAYWLEVDLGEEAAIASAVLCEDMSSIKKFELQWKDGDTWRTFATGGKIGRLLKVSFQPIKARFVRIYIPKDAGQPELLEFQLFPPK